MTTSATKPIYSKQDPADCHNRDNLTCPPIPIVTCCGQSLGSRVEWIEWVFYLTRKSCLESIRRMKFPTRRIAIREKQSRENTANQYPARICSETVRRTRESEHPVTSGSRDSGRELIQSRDVTLPPAKFVARVERTNAHSDSK